jgi:hypothetical protein
MTMLLYFALSGAFFFLPFDLIENQGYSATLAGTAFRPFTLIMVGCPAGQVASSTTMARDFS